MMLTPRSTCGQNSPSKSVLGVSKPFASRPMPNTPKPMAVNMARIDARLKPKRPKVR